MSTDKTGPLPLITRLRQTFPETPHHRDALHREAADALEVWQERLELAVAAERERCIEAVEGNLDGSSYALSPRIAALIVERIHGAAPVAEASAGVPPILFDGYAVFKALSLQAQARTSQENVSDVLDAVVYLLRPKKEPL